jgi:hypothetical protein
MKSFFVSCIINLLTEFFSSKVIIRGIIFFKLKLFRCLSNLSNKLSQKSNSLSKESKNLYMYSIL